MKVVIWTVNFPFVILGVQQLLLSKVQILTSAHYSALDYTSLVNVADVARQDFEKCSIHSINHSFCV